MVEIALGALLAGWVVSALLVATATYLATAWALERRLQAVQQAKPPTVGQAWPEQASGAPPPVRFSGAEPTPPVEPERPGEEQPELAH